MKCIQCKLNLSLDKFYKTAHNKSGYTGKCKKCCIKQCVQWQKKNKQKAKLYNRKWRLANPDKLIAQKKRYYSGKGKIKNAKFCREYSKNNKYKIQAHSKVLGALRAGKLKQFPCCICKNKKSQAHHCNYRKPLEVMWLCSKHHSAWHRVFKPIGA